MEYTGGTKELSYSFNKNLKRYHDFDKALQNAEEVEFLDLDISYVDNSESLLKNIDKEIHRFVNLKKLTIWGKGGEKNHFPKNLFNLESIEFLAICNYNKLDISDLSSLDNLSNLKFLAFSYCNLTELPKSLFELDKLEGLDLTLNNLEELPESMVNLENLRTIDLTNNCLKNIPEILTKCEYIEWLDVNNAEGTDIVTLRNMGNCMNKINNIEILDSFKSLKEVSLFNVFDKDYIQELDNKFSEIKIK